MHTIRVLQYCHEPGHERSSKLTVRHNKPQFTKSRRVGRVAAVGRFNRRERLTVVIQRGRLKNDAEGSHETRRGENPQEQAVQHHGNILPVLNNLEGGKQQGVQG